MCDQIMFVHSILCNQLNCTCQKRILDGTAVHPHAPGFCHVPVDGVFRYRKLGVGEVVMVTVTWVCHSVREDVSEKVSYVIQYIQIDACTEMVFLMLGMENIISDDRNKIFTFDESAIHSMTRSNRGEWLSNGFYDHVRNVKTKFSKR